jgi:hypothetical protein
MDVELLEESGFGEAGGFLQEIYGVMEPRLSSPEFWRWKCLRPHPFWSGSRGFFRRSGGKICAYASLIPLRFLTSAGAISSAHVIDWAASRGVPGAGVRLYRHLQSMAGSAIGIGGSQETRQILPRMGAVLRQTVAAYRRPLRPFTAASRGKKDWKWPARLARDLRYALPPLASVPAGWEAVRVRRFDDSVQCALPAASPEVLVSERTVDLLNYWLECPAAQVSGYLIRDRGKVAGYFLLSAVADVAKIADLWLRPDAPGLWAAAYSLAFRAAAELPVLTVETMTGHPLAQRALDQMQLRRGENQVFLLDPEKTVPDRMPLALSQVDYDGFYL